MKEQKTILSYGYKLIILFCLLSLCLPSYAAIESNIEYNLESIKQEAFAGVYKHCPFPDKTSMQHTYFTQKFDETDVLSITQDEQGFTNVVYKDYPSFTYSYKYKKANFYNTLGGYYCNHISVNYGNKIATYCFHLYKLLAVRFIVSPDEEIAFDMNGNIIGHKKGDIVEKNEINIRGMHKAIYSK